MGAAIFDVASRADVPGVIALIGRVFAEYGFLYDPATEVPDLLDFERHYQPPQGGFFVLRQGEVIAGSVGIERIDAATAELHRLYLDYPTEALRETIRSALGFGLTDLARLERMLLTRIAGEYFRLLPPPGNDDDDKET